MPNFVVIIGPQAVGKMTVGQELAKITGYKLLYNHMTVEMLKDIFDYDRETFLKMNQTIRTDIFREFSKSQEKGIILTVCFDFGEGFDEDKRELDNWKVFFKKTYVVELETSLEERLKRNKTQNRLEYKPSKRDLVWSENELLRSEKKHRLNSETGEGDKLFENFIKINNTNLEPDVVAKMIKDKFNI